MVVFYPYPYAYAYRGDDGGDACHPCHAEASC